MRDDISLLLVFFFFLFFSPTLSNGMGQIHPVVARLLEPIEGTDAAQLAHCLGLDPGAFSKEIQQ